MASAPCTTPGNVADTHCNEVRKVLVKQPMQLLLLCAPSFTLQAPENPFSLGQGEPCVEELEHPAFPAVESERTDGPIVRHKVLDPFANYFAAKVVVPSQNLKLGIYPYFVLYLIMIMSFQHSLV